MNTNHVPGMTLELVLAVDEYTDILRLVAGWQEIDIPLPDVDYPKIDTVDLIGVIRAAGKFPQMLDPVPIETVLFANTAFDDKHMVAWFILNGAVIGINYSRNQQKKIYQQNYDLLKAIEDRNAAAGIVWPYGDIDKLVSPDDGGTQVLEQQRATDLPAITTTGYELDLYLLASHQAAMMIGDGLGYGQGWKDDTKRLRRVYEERSDNKNYPFVGCLSVGKEEGMIPDEIIKDPGAVALWMKPLQEITDRYDMLRSDIHDILVMHWLEHMRTDGRAFLTVADLIRYREKTTRSNNKVRMKDLRRYSDALRDVLRPGIEGTMVVHEKGSRKGTPKRLTGKVWHADIGDIPPLPGWGEGLIEFIVYNPGEWLKLAIEPYHQQLMIRTKALLSLDPYRQEMHKKIGKRLDYYFRVAQGKPCEITMKVLLEKSHVEIPDWAEKKGDAGKFIQTVEKVLWELFGMGVISDFSPQDVLTTPDLLPPRKKLRPWLDLMYTFCPPSDTQEKYQEIQNRRILAIEEGKQAAAAAKQKTPDSEGA